MSHLRPNPPPALGGSGVGYLMGDMGRVTRLGSLAGGVDESNSDKADGVPIGAGRTVVVDSDPGEVDGMPIGAVRKVFDDSNPDEIDGVPTDVLWRVVGGSNPDKTDGVSVGAVWTVVCRSLGSINRLVSMSGCRFVWVCVQS